MRRGRILVVAGALWYSAWILAPTLGSHLNGLHSYVSEVAATGQPYALLFRATDLAAGLCLTVGTVRWWRATRRPGWTGHAVFAGILVLGVATMADSLLPLSCTPTADAACAFREQSGSVPLTHAAHAWSSGIADTGAAIAVIAALWWLATVGRGRLARTGLAAVLWSTAAFGVGTAWTLAAIAWHHGPLLLGLAQRLQIVGLTAWLIAVATAELPRGAAPSALLSGGGVGGGEDRGQ